MPINNKLAEMEQAIDNLDADCRCGNVSPKTILAVLLPVISRLLDAAHADALSLIIQHCDEERARLERELEVARATLREADDWFEAASHFENPADLEIWATNVLANRRTKVADLEAKIGKLDGQSQLK